MARLHLYARVSTDDQATSASAQAARLKDFAAGSEMETAGLYVDEDVSGAKPLKHRPEGKRLWDAVQPGDVVVVTKVDRAFRSLADAVNTLEVWTNLGVGVRILDLGIDLATPAGQLFFQQLCSFAQFERALLGQRLREAVAHLKREGKPFANFRPFGWTRKGNGKQKRFEPLGQERALGQRVVRMRESGLSWAEIATALYEDRITKPGKGAAVRAGRHRGAYYLEAEVRRLYRATRAGFPIQPREAVGR
jgi:DNA invertase Pin-like site-specific DNA recombinase